MRLYTYCVRVYGFIERVFTDFNKDFLWLILLPTFTSDRMINNDVIIMSITMY